MQHGLGPDSLSVSGYNSSLGWYEQLRDNQPVPGSSFSPSPPTGPGSEVHSLDASQPANDDGNTSSSPTQLNRKLMSAHNELLLSEELTGSELESRNSDGVAEEEGEDEIAILEAQLQIAKLQAKIKSLKSRKSSATTSDSPNNNFRAGLNLSQSDGGTTRSGNSS